MTGSELLPAPPKTNEPNAVALEGVLLAPGEPNALVRDGVLVCPYPNCGTADQIVELDVATRSNELHIVEPGEIAAYTGDSTLIPGQNSRKSDEGRSSARTRGRGA